MKLSVSSEHSLKHFELNVGADGVCQFAVARLKLLAFRNRFRLGLQLGEKSENLPAIPRELSLGFHPFTIIDRVLVKPTGKGTPQGGPLSPLLSNIILYDLDKELEKRGHSFYRYVDDCNIYVATQRSGERVLASITNYLDRSFLISDRCSRSLKRLSRASWYELKKSRLCGCQPA